MIELECWGRHQGGKLQRTNILLGLPTPDLSGNDYTCSFAVVELELDGAALGAHPVQAMEHALFQVRMRMAHRYPEWTFHTADGAQILLDY